MSWLWLFLAALTVCGSLAYNTGVKMGAGHMNPFVFTVVLTLVAAVGHFLCLGFYKYFTAEGVKLQYDTTGLWYAVLAGVGVVIIDLGFFFAVREGGLMNSTGFWVIGSLLCTTILSALIFHEQISAMKAAGLVLGAVSLFLLVKSSA